MIQVTDSPRVLRSVLRSGEIAYFECDAFPDILVRGDPPAGGEPGVLSVYTIRNGRVRCAWEDLDPAILLDPHGEAEHEAPSGDGLPGCADRDATRALFRQIGRCRVYEKPAPQQDVP